MWVGSCSVNPKPNISGVGSSSSNILQLSAQSCTPWFAQTQFCRGCSSSSMSKLKLTTNRRQRPLQLQLQVRAGTRLAPGMKRRVKERQLDEVISRQKKLNLVSSIIRIMLLQPHNEISVFDLSRHKTRLGIAPRRRILPILRRYPAIFNIFQDPSASSRRYLCRLTPQALELHSEVSSVQSEIEDLLVQNLRKLLMMSWSKRILLDKIAILAPDMGLPPDFRDGICSRYPQFFNVVDTDFGPALQLSSWDPSLAVAFAEKSSDKQDGDLVVERPRKYKKLNLPNGFSVPRKERNFLLQFQESSFMSPYSHSVKLHPASMQAERRDCAVIHELLSLTQEKKLLVHNVTIFKHEFKYIHKIRPLLLRHPDMFYISLKGGIDSVFLREAYEGPGLKQKGPLLLCKEKLQGLLSVGMNKGAIPESLLDEDSEQDSETEELYLDGSLHDDNEEEDAGGHNTDLLNSQELEIPSSGSELFRTLSLRELTAQEASNIKTREYW